MTILLAPLLFIRTVVDFWKIMHVHSPMAHGYLNVTRRSVIKTGSDDYLKYLVKIGVRAESMYPAAFGPRNKP